MNKTFGTIYRIQIVSLLTHMKSISFISRLLSLFLLLVLMVPFSSFAQTEQDIPQPLLALPDVDTPGAISCFDYYSFGSVQVDVAPYFSEVFNTDLVIFGGHLKNNNSYPVVNGQVYMKVFKKEQESPEFLKENGYPLVDFVLVEDNITIPANSEKPFKFDWMVPNNAPTGDYKAAFFFTTEHRYNLLGLSFTDDVTGNTAPFSVINTTDYQPVAFDKNSVRLNDTSHSFALPSWHFEKDEQITAYATLVNSSDDVRTVELHWTTYKWDGILESNKKDEKIQKVSLQPHTEIEVGYATPVLDTSVTFVQVEAHDGDTSSVMHIRYIRDGLEETRINYPSINNYPLKKGEEATIFSCLHSTNLPVVSDSTLVLTLTDPEGHVLHKYTYEGDVTGLMMGVKDTFVPDRNLANLSLTAELLHKDEIVEKVTVVYRCEDINPELCGTDTVYSSEEGVSSEDTSSLNSTVVMFFFAVSLLVLVGLVLYVRKEKEGLEDDLKTPNNKELS